MNGQLSVVLPGFTDFFFISFLENRVGLVEQDRQKRRLAEVTEFLPGFGNGTAAVLHFPFVFPPMKKAH